MTYEEIKTHFDRLVAGQPTNILAVSHRGLQNACNGALAKAAGGDDNRKLVLKGLTGRTSTKGLTLNEWYALFRFVFPMDESGSFVFKNPVTDKWEGRPELTAWCGAIFAHLAEQEGQLQMFEAVEA